MKRTKLFLISTLLLCLPTLIYAQESEKAKDEAAVKQVVQYYFDGWKNNDVESMRKAFHPKAKWFNASNTNDLRETTQSQVYANFRDNIRRQSSQPVKLITKIASMDVAGQAASIKVELEYSTAYPGSNAGLRKTPPGIRYIEYLSLIKFDDGWKIVGKVSSVEEISPSGQSAMRQQ